MTAFDNIKVNNWPATSNDLEDFLVLKLPLNDTASLSESLPVNAGSQELFPKRTLTNSNVKAKRAGVSITDAGTITGSPYDANHAMEFAFRDGYDTYGQPATSQSAAFASNGGTYKIVFADGGYSVSQNIVLKFYINGGNIKVNAGETDEQEFTSSDGSGFQTWTIAASSVSQLKNVQLTNDTNTGPYWSGIYVDGVQLANPPGGTKKHYPENAIFNGSSQFLYHAPDKLFNFGTDDWCIECWFKKDDFQATGELFQLGLEVYYTNNIEISVNTQGAMRYHMYGNGTSQEGFTSSNNVVTAGTWHHMACTRQGTTFRGFLDGVQLGSWTKDATWNVGSSNSDHHSPTIGARTNGSRNAMHVYFGGSIQDFRIYKGVAKYTANFTPPSAILV